MEGKAPWSRDLTEVSPGWSIVRRTGNQGVQGVVDWGRIWNFMPSEVKKNIGRFPPGK